MEGMEAEWKINFLFLKDVEHMEDMEDKIPNHMQIK